jgi:hypothetical protein
VQKREIFIYLLYKVVHESVCYGMRAEGHVHPEGATSALRFGPSAPRSAITAGSQPFPLPPPSLFHTIHLYLPFMECARRVMFILKGQAHFDFGLARQSAAQLLFKSTNRFLFSRLLCAFCLCLALIGLSRHSLARLSDHGVQGCYV